MRSIPFGFGRNPSPTAAPTEDVAIAARNLSYLVFNFVSAVSVTIINKYCFTHVKFDWPAALCNIHMAVTWLGVEVLRRCGTFDPLPPRSMRESRLRDNDFLSIVVVVGLVTPLNNTSLKLNSVGFYQLFKLLVTPAVIALEYVLDRTRLSLPRAMALVAVCVFVGVSSLNDLSFSAYGTACATVWIPLAAAYKVQWGRVRRKYDCSTLALMYSVIPLSMIVQAVITPMVDPPGLTTFRWTPEAVFWIGLSSASAFAVNFSGFLVMANLGALAHVLLGQLKTAIIMVGSFLVFGTIYTTMQLVGALGAVISIVVYTRVTMNEKEKEGTLYATKN